MKHIFLILLTFFAFSANAKDDGLSLIKRRGYVKCGTDFDVKAFAYKDDEGFYHGIDVDACKIFALAIFGKESAIKMVDVGRSNIEKVLAHNVVDVVIGGKTLLPSQEMASSIMPAALLYYDNLKFIAYKKENATSMKDYKGANVCLVKDNSAKEKAIVEYNKKYGLEFNFLPYPSKRKAKEAFLLNRCDVLADGEMYLKNFGIEKAHIINETIEIIPVNVLVDKKNQSLAIAVKWIVNALILAEEMGVDKTNYSMFNFSQDLSDKNVMGSNPETWQGLGLKPDWVLKALSLFGNYGEIYEKNIGSLGVERDKNNLIKNKGYLQGQRFI